MKILSASLCVLCGKILENPLLVQPIFIATWPFGVAACRAGWQKLHSGSSALDAIEAGANVTERDPAVNSVGYGGLPNAEGIVELDAAIMDGPTHGAGAVAGITKYRTPISIARRVMERTSHVLLVGQNADRFARSEGFEEEELLTEEARAKYEIWLRDKSASEVAHFTYGSVNGTPTPDNHDTIGLCALDSAGNLAVGCTTSGMAWSVPGRVGDSPIIGAGLYVDNEIGGAAGTGNGDEMMKACLSYRIVMLMGEGREPEEACAEALRYLMRKRDPETFGQYGAGVIALRKDGKAGAAATRSGYRSPDALWQWAIADGPEPRLNEGPYVTATETIQTLSTK